jgi:hypothetical protein
MDENSKTTRPDDTDHDPLLPPGGDGVPTDAGGYIGNEPELARETIPGGVQRGDVRVAGVATQPTGAGADAHTGTGATDTGGGHREGPEADDDRLRQAGVDR